MILPNKPVILEKLEPDKIYIQVAAVTAYLDPTETHRVTPYERNFGIRTSSSSLPHMAMCAVPFVASNARLWANVDKFIFESAIRAKGDSDADSKKKTIFFTELEFPYVNTRLEVVKTEEVSLVSDYRVGVAASE